MAALTLEQAFPLALGHHQAGRLAEAEAMYRQILAAQPNHAEALHLLGVLAAGAGRFEEAIGWISRAITLLPGRPVFHVNLGVAFRRMGRLEDAAANLQRAVALAPQMAEAHMNLGDAEIGLGRMDEAIASNRRALALRPDYAEASNNLGNALGGKQRWDEAMACYHRALALRPDYAEAHNNVGNALIEHGRWSEAIPHCRRALELKPDLIEAYENVGIALVETQEFGAALDFFRQAIAVRPDFAPVHWNLALLLMRIGRWEEGWREYEWRWRHDGFASQRRNFPVPQWDDSRAKDATVLIHTEQGFGDTLQFLRYVPLVAARVGRVILECPEKLVRLVVQSGGWNADIVVRGTGALPLFDRHIPMLSLPLALGHFEPLPMEAPYLRADSGMRAAWRERIGSSSDRRVGLAWAGSPEHRQDARRSIAEEKLLPLLHMPDVRFFSLQAGPRGALPQVLADAGVTDLRPHLTDFADTAALMAELDLIITVDTSVAHLAGALGRPVWMLLPYVPDWRWGLEKEDTPWYPSMRLFRQPRMGDWDSVIRRVAEELRALQTSAMGK